MTLAGGGATVLEEQGRDLVYSCTLRTACHLAAVGGVEMVWWWWDDLLLSGQHAGLNNTLTSLRQNRTKMSTFINSISVLQIKVTL